MNELTRAWAYRVSLAVITVAGVYGIVSDQQSAGWVALATALFSSGLAAVNTSTRKDS